MSNIRLKEVAAEAGVSVTTASDALRGNPRVRPATREKVEEAARRLDYRKHSAASALSRLATRQRQKSLSLIWLTALDKTGANWDMAPRYARVEAERLGIRFEHINMSDPSDIARNLRTAEARGIDGIVLGDRVRPVSCDTQLAHFSVISTQESWLAKGADVVRANQFRSTLMLLERVRSAGYRRIGILMRVLDPLHPDDESRLGAALYFLTYAVDPTGRIPLLRLAFHQADEKETVCKWVADHSPDAVIGFNSADLKLLRQVGVEVPAACAFAALHVEQEMRGRIAGCVHNKELIPAHAIRVLFGKVCQGARGLTANPLETTVIAPILSGDSCPRLPVGDPIQNGTKIHGLPY